MRSFYELLGVSRQASNSEILNAYRRKVMETHPDKGGNPIDFMNIKKAYDILSNTSLRQKYDKWLYEREKNENITNSNNSQNKIEKIKDKINTSIVSFLNQNCESENIRKEILSVYYNSTNIFNDIDLELSYEKILVIVVKKCITIIVSKGAKIEDLKYYVSLDTICSEKLSKENDLEKQKNIHSSQTENSNNKYWNYLFVGLLGCLLFIIVILNYYNSKNEEVEVDNNSKEQIYSKENNDFQKNNSRTISKTNVDRTESNIRNNNSNKLTTKPKQQKDGNLPLKYEITDFKTGDIPYLQQFGKGVFDRNSLSSLRVKNHSSTDAVILLVNNNGKICRNVYLKKNAVFSLDNISKGKYSLKIMFGNNWYSKKNNGENMPKGGFMENVSYMKTPDNEFNFYPQEVSDGINYPTYSVTLYKVANGNLSTENIDEEEFFK